MVAIHPLMYAHHTHIRLPVQPREHIYVVVLLHTKVLCTYGTAVRIIRGTSDICSNIMRVPGATKEKKTEEVRGGVGESPPAVMKYVVPLQRRHMPAEKIGTTIAATGAAACAAAIILVVPICAKSFQTHYTSTKRAAGTTWIVNRRYRGATSTLYQYLLCHLVSYILVLLSWPHIASTGIWYRTAAVVPCSLTSGSKYESAADQGLSQRRDHPSSSRYLPFLVCFLMNLPPMIVLLLAGLLAGREQRWGPVLS